MCSSDLARRASRPKPPKAAGESTPTMKLSPATKPTSISSGSNDKSLADLDNLPDPDLLAGEIIENLEAGLASFQEILGVLGRG